MEILQVVPRRTNKDRLKMLASAGGWKRGKREKREKDDSSGAP